MRDAGQPTQGAENPGLGLSVRLRAGCPQDSKEEEAARGCGLAPAAGEGRRGVSLVQLFRVCFPSSPCFCPRVPRCVLTALLVPQPPHPPGISRLGCPDPKTHAPFPQRHPSLPQTPELPPSLGS